MALFGSTNGNGSDSGVALEVDAALEINSRLDHIEQLIQAAATQERRTPRYIKLPFFFAVPTTAARMFAVDVGGPLQGRHWFITRVAADVQWNTAQLSTNPPRFYVATGPQGNSSEPISWPGNPANPGYGFQGFQQVNTEFAAFNSGGTFPVAENWGREQFVVQFPEHVWISVLQPSTATGFTVVGLIAATDLAVHEDPRYQLNIRPDQTESA